MDKNWKRVKILDWAPERKYCQIQYVDYGNTDIVCMDSQIIYPLEELSDVLSNFPAQALQVKILFLLFYSTLLLKMYFYFMFI